MKLTLTMIHDDDADETVNALVSHGFYVTRLSSTGGFLRKGNTILLSGVEDDRVDQMVKVLQNHTDVHIQPPTSLISQETIVNRAVVFILEMEQLIRL